MRQWTGAVLAVLLATAAFAGAMAERTQKPGRADARFRVAVLVFRRAEDIDFAGPIEVLAQNRAEIFTVAASREPIVTVAGLHITPDYDLDHAPAADLILVPGGGVNDTARDGKIIAWLRDRATTARYVMSVCNGAFILANAGLLDGLTATTTAGHIDHLAERFPKVHVVRERYVDNGRIITTAGLSAGIDGALHVIDREFGRPRAEQVARNIEYRWDPASKWTRSRYADMRMPDIEFPQDANWQILTSNGDEDHWTMSGRLHIHMTEESALDMTTKQLKDEGWEIRGRSGGTRTFVKADREGQTWQFTVTSFPDKEASTWLETLSVQKVVE